MPRVRIDVTALVRVRHLSTLPQNPPQARDNVSIIPSWRERERCGKAAFGAALSPRISLNVTATKAFGRSLSTSNHSSRSAPAAL